MEDQGSGMVCLIKPLPGAGGTVGEARVKVPARQLERFEAAGFTRSNCAKAGKPPVVTGLTVCDQIKNGNNEFKANFKQRNKVDPVAICAQTAKQNGVEKTSLPSS